MQDLELLCLENPESNFVLAIVKNFWIFTNEYFVT